MSMGASETTTRSSAPGCGRRHREPGRPAPALQGARALRDVVEALPHHRLELKAGRRQVEGAVAAAKEGHAQVVLQVADLPADRLAADAQLLTRPGEAEMARGGLEGDQGVQRRQARA
jgi:hypothetical protein